MFGRSDVIERNKQAQVSMAEDSLWPLALLNPMGLVLVIRLIQVMTEAEVIQMITGIDRRLAEIRALAASDTVHPAIAALALVSGRIDQDKGITGLVGKLGIEAAKLMSDSNLPAEITDAAKSLASEFASNAVDKGATAAKVGQLAKLALPYLAGGGFIGGSSGPLQALPVGDPTIVKP